MQLVLPRNRLPETNIPLVSIEHYIILYAMRVAKELSSATMTCFVMQIMPFEHNSIRSKDIILYLSNRTYSRPKIRLESCKVDHKRTKEDDYKPK